MTSNIRIGVVGAGFIADVVANAISETDARLVAVTSRRPESARAFAVKHDGLRVFESFEEMVNWDGLDAVYVATPTSPREDVCIAAVENGKHILAEKPFASLGSLQTITRACRTQNVAFMDATHFSHHPRTGQLKREITERIGKIQSIYSSFFFPAMDKNNIRFNPALEPTGAFGDMAWYSMRAVAEFASSDASVLDASGFVQKDKESGACVRSAGALLLSDGCTSTWDVGYNVGTNVMDLSLYGQKGMIKLDDFVLDWADGFADNIPDYPVGFTHRSGVANPDNFQEIATPTDHSQLVCMLQKFSELASDPMGQAAMDAIRISERTQGLLDAVWDRLTII